MGIFHKVYKLCSDVVSSFYFSPERTTTTTHQINHNSGGRNPLSCVRTSADELDLAVAAGRLVWSTFGNPVWLVMRCDPPLHTRVVVRATRGPPGMIQSSRTGSDTVMLSRRRRTGPGGLSLRCEGNSFRNRQEFTGPEAVK